jgi:hypothetical protein
VSPGGGGSVGELFGVGEEAGAAAGELSLAGGVAAVGVDVAALDVALLLTGAAAGGVDEATTLAVVDVAAGAGGATEVVLQLRLLTWQRLARGRV